MNNGHRSASTVFESWFGDAASRLEEALMVVTSYNKGWLMTIILLNDKAAGLAFRPDGDFFGIVSQIPGWESAVLTSLKQQDAYEVLWLLTETAQRVLDESRKKNEKHG